MDEDEREIIWEGLASNYYGGYDYIIVEKDISDPDRVDRGWVYVVWENGDLNDDVVDDADFNRNYGHSDFYSSKEDINVAVPLKASEVLQGV